MGIDYVAEKLSSAMHYAIGSSASVQERLAGAMQLVCHLDSDDFGDDDLWKRFQELLKETTKHAAKGNEGTIVATTSRMSDDEAGRWLRKSLDLYSDVCEAYANTENP